MGRPERINEVINERFNKLNLNDNINDKRERKSNKAIQTEYIANKLQDEFHAPQSYAFFLKCAWNMTEGDIWDAVEASKRPWIKSPIKYFVKTCSNAMSVK